MPADGLPRAVTDATAELLGQVAGTVGVITPVPCRDEVAGWLDGLAGSRLQVVDALAAKGMEYDGVLVVAPERIRADSA